MDSLGELFNNRYDSILLSDFPGIESILIKEMITTGQDLMPEDYSPTLALSAVIMGIASLKNLP